MNKSAMKMERAAVDLGAASAWRGAILTELFDAIRACNSDTYALWEHSLAVGATSMRLATSLGLPRGARRLVYLGGLLHDVGKTLTRRDVLFKAGMLTPRERAHMRLHPEAGERLVRGLELEPVSNAVLYHHERLDGSGYPEGLAGARIPYAARIVAIADHYEATRESRPYRPVASTRSEALAFVDGLAAAGKLDRTIARWLPAAVAPGTPQPSRYFEAIARIFDLRI